MRNSGTRWLTHGKLITPRGIIDGAVKIDDGRIAAITRTPTRGARAVNVRGAYVAPGFIDLHVWGPPEVVSREAAKGGASGFLSTLGPAPLAQLTEELKARVRAAPSNGAAYLGIHLEGPFLNPARGGALPRQWMQRPTLRVLEPLARAAGGRLKLITLAPELPGALEAIRWCRRRKIVVSLGHTDADAVAAARAVAAGATAVTHVFNGMRPFHHRGPTLLDAALTERRLTTMVIADGVHVGAGALRLLIRTKGSERIALVTDSIRHQGWDVTKRDARPGDRHRRAGGAFYLKDGTLAGSDLSMIGAVRHAVELGGAPLSEAVRMAGEVPARLLGLRDRGRLAVGARADLVAFDRKFRVQMTLVGGRVAYKRSD